MILTEKINNYEKILNANKEEMAEIARKHQALVSTIKSFSDLLYY
jgi:hypothetical protein